MKQLFIALFALALTLTSMAQVTKILNVTTAGTLSSLLTAEEKSTITNLTLSGNIDARDFKCMRDEIVGLAVLDIKDVYIIEFIGDGGTAGYSYYYPSNEIPYSAFYEFSTNLGKSTLYTVILPNSAISIGTVAFGHCFSLTNVTFGDSLQEIGDYVFGRIGHSQVI